MLSPPGEVPKDGASFSLALGRLREGGEKGGHLCFSMLRAPRSAGLVAQRGTRSGPPSAWQAGQRFRLFFD